MSHKANLTDEQRETNAPQRFEYFTLDIMSPNDEIVLTIENEGVSPGRVAES